MWLMSLASLLTAKIWGGINHKRDSRSAAKLKEAVPLTQPPNRSISAPVQSKKLLGQSPTEYRVQVKLAA